MSTPAPEGAVCATHPETAAAWSCGRCGAFFCVACERRTRPDALPMCPGCWALREKKVPAVQAASETRLQTAGLVMGVVALVPMCWWLQIASIVVNIVGIVKAKEGKAREARWRSVAGLVCACLGMLATVAVVTFGALRGR